MAEPATGARKYLQWWPIVGYVLLAAGGDAVQAYQVEELRTDMDGIQKVQTQQALTERDIQYIQKDVETLDDKLKDMGDKLNDQGTKLDLILQRLSQ